MSTCPATARSVLARTGAMAVVFGTSFGLVLGSTGLALAQDAAPSTVRAVIGDDGSVKDVDRIGSDEAPGDLPVTLRIVEAVDGSTTTTSYTVENTTVENQTISYLGADGQPTTAQHDVALPLVAQLAVRLPASRTDVNAVGARVTRLADGSTELVWSMVLFGPIGSPVADVSFSSTGGGDAVARLDVAAVQPNATPGLSAVGQAANATVNGNGILSTVANGANEGLVKLSDGVGQLLAGLDRLYAGAQQLNTGIDAAVDGANQLADGSEKAAAGSGELATGLGQLADGSTALAKGAGDLDTGAGKVVAGLDAASTGGSKLAEGSTQLAAGADQAAAGAAALSDGLALISGGLDQLSAAQGLPAALDGANRLQVGVDALRAGLGAAETPGTILNGVAQISGGLGLLAAPSGLPAAKAGVDAVKLGVDQKILPGLGDPEVPAATIRYAVEMVRKGLAEGSADGGGIDTLVALVTLARSGILGCGPGLPSPEPQTACEGVNTALFGLSHAPGTLGPDDPGGLKERSQAAASALEGAGTGLTAVVTGLDSADPSSPGFPGVSQALGLISGKPSTETTPASGLSKAIEGVQLLKAGIDGYDADGDPATPIDNGLTYGLNRIALGLESGDPTNPGVAEGLDALVAGLTSAVAGVGQLATGAQTAAAGSSQLATGNTALASGAAQLADGNVALASGLSQLYTGSQELKAGTAKLSDGGDQLAAGATKAYTGARELSAGLGQIATGQRKVADGLPAAADGSGQLADGLGQVLDGQQSVSKGLGDVRSQAVEVLSSQFAQGTELARQQLAGLDAASAMIASTEGAATTTWVLTQGEDGSIELTSGSSDLGRNAAIGVGGALLLMAGVAGGYIGGRRQTVTG